MTYHYKRCGLDYVYLKGGVAEKETPYGKGTSIKKADELNWLIALILITSPNRLSGQEVRFLRSLLDVSQKELASLLGAQRVTIARWESKTHTPIPGPADRLLRFVVARSIGGKKAGDLFEAVCGNLAEIGDPPRTELVLSYEPLEEQDTVSHEKWRAYG